MKKLLFVLYWLVMVYAGDRDRIYFRAKECPRFLLDGRWIQFVDIYGKTVYVSTGPAVTIREQDD